jgi:hypothetical protein
MLVRGATTGSQEEICPLALVRLQFSTCKAHV